MIRVSLWSQALLVAVEGPGVGERHGPSVSGGKMRTDYTQSIVQFLTRVSIIVIVEFATLVVSAWP